MMKFHVYTSYTLLKNEKSIKGSLKNTNIIIIVTSIIIILLTSCKTDSKLDQLLESINSSISLKDKLAYKGTPIDSLNFVKEPKIILKIYNEYDDLEGLESEMRKNIDPKIKYISDYSFAIMYHMYINNMKIDSTNFKIYSKLINVALDNDREKNQKKICNYVFENIRNFEAGDYVNFTLEVETDSEGTRAITYGSRYDQIYPKKEYEDSVEIKGLLIRKGLYQDSRPKELDSLDCDGYIFELKLVEVSDTSIDRRVIGPSNKLLKDELFYLDLEGFGCRYLKR